MRALLRLWGAPLAIAILTMAGLIGALAGDGHWNGVAAIGLATPVVVGAWFGLRRK